MPIYLPYSPAITSTTFPHHFIIHTFTASQPHTSSIELPQPQKPNSNCNKIVFNKGKVFLPFGLVLRTATRGKQNADLLRQVQRLCIQGRSLSVSLCPPPLLLSFILFPRLFEPSTIRASPSFSLSLSLFVSFPVSNVCLVFNKL